MKQRKFKFSLGMKIASILSCIALVSVGFASWWIIKPVEDKTVDGSFTVYSVSEKEVVISDETLANSMIVFGKSTTPAPQYNWLYPDGVLDQNLSSTLSFKLKVVESGDDQAGIKVNQLVENVVITLTPSDATNLENAIEAGYIKNFKISYNGQTETYNTSTDSIKLTIPAGSFSVTEQTISGVTISFEWGDTFGGKNPYLYYNGMEYDADISGTEAHAHANQHLGDLNTYLTNMTYDVVISAEAKAFSAN